jgi:hypothetical protein
MRASSSPIAARFILATIEALASPSSVNRLVLLGWALELAPSLSPASCYAENDGDFVTLELRLSCP